MNKDRELLNSMMDLLHLDRCDVLGKDPDVTPERAIAWATACFMEAKTVLTAVVDKNMRRMYCTLLYLNQEK